MKAIILIGFLGIIPFSFALTGQEVVKKMQAAYAAMENIEYSATYELFKGHSSKEIHSSYKGYMYRLGTQVYQKIDKTEFVYGSEYFLQISHSEKALVLDLAPKTINMEVDQAVVFNECSQVKLEEFDDFYVVKLIYKATSSLPFSVTKMRIHKGDYLLQQLDFYYTIQENFSNDRRHPEMDQPHLKIRFTDIDTHPKTKETFFKLDRYIGMNNNTIQPTGNCLGYELIDNRVK